MSKIEIIGFEPRYAKDFERLNIAWLEKYFYVEPYDAKVLADPQQYFIDKGGEIYLLRDDEIIIGTLALMFHEGNELEVTKMAVDERYQGQGLGRKLMEFVLKRAQELAPSKIFLLTSSSLEVANNLYANSGFIKVPCRPEDSQIYERCDVRWELPQSEVTNAACG